ncbi:hypothetical protein C2G38_2113129 [Gigaspora rosea]|uniref:Phosphatidylglycerol/phosphatidylinositol transfer protein n=1 Tax=Gigaspora rosea TaxID=44941 RepID=A0A397UBU8_9GLOM|nr:hypothetical protein C2G38_2113129 [Gigaspora rosea]
MKNFIFVFILFATLLTVNAAPYQFDKRATPFKRCPDDLPSPNVIMTPDPLVAGESANFNVSGILFTDIYAGIAVLRIRFFSDPTRQTLIANPYYQDFTELFPAYTPFTIVAPKVDIPNNLTNKYTIEVVIGSEKVDDIYGCSLANVEK